MVSNSFSPLPYDLHQVADNTFEFVSDQGKKYSIYTTEAGEYFPEGTPFAKYTRMFGFGPKGSLKSPKNQDGKRAIESDPRISRTIIFSILDYFQEDPKNILVYVCDQTDNRHHNRQRLFNKWSLDYLKYNIWGQRPMARMLIHKDITNSPSICAYMFYRVDNPFRKNIEDSLMDIIGKIGDLTNED